ncbi:MAG: bifunctional (p)ppGpp synthetase/guanosine-3',5'-bis(diphosphate) 3'-pyrophosphohydrolase [SAR324 cluster bacterium]|nr:bifunctional (p)ppGpp synthetase/guanosine-3',5'-bis(diphosphate) 3'-pyrophosphohydrolase [SAR324 cluster bacterium]
MELLEKSKKENIYSPSHSNEQDKKVRLIEKYVNSVLGSEPSTTQQRTLKCGYLAYNLLIKGYFDQQSALSCLLVPIINEKNCDWDKIAQITSKDVVSILQAYAMLKNIDEDISHQEKLAESIKQLLMLAKIDLRVIFIRIGYWYGELKLIKELGNHNEASTLVDEVLHIYAPIAHRLGLYIIKNEMEELSFAWQNPKKYHEIDDFLQERLQEGKGFYERMNYKFKDILSEHDIDFEFSYRTKSAYSIYKKSLDQELDYHTLHDLIACRLIVETNKECYWVLGLVHTAFTPVSGRFKDYISHSKSNGYQSLHTTVVDENGVIFEIQIRTKVMHHLAEYGLASHWDYKSGSKSKQEHLKQVNWLRGLLANFQGTEDVSEHIMTLKRSLYLDKIYVFTPKGKMIELPHGASLLDFAYSIHSEVGHSCIGGRINGHFSAIKTKLESGQQIEIITNTKARPNSGWLKICRTNRAQQLIRQELKKKLSIGATKMGQKSLQKALAGTGISFSKLEENPNMLKYLKRKSLTNYQDLLQEIGFANIEPEDVIKSIAPLKPIKTRDKIKDWLKNPLNLTKRTLENKESKGSLLGIPSRIAMCCQPTPGDELVGLIAKSGVVKIHRKDCVNLLKTNLNDKKILSLNWEDNIHQTLSINLIFEFSDNLISLNKIIEILTGLKVKMNRSTTSVIDDKKMQLSIFLELESISTINIIKKKLKKYPDIVVKQRQIV